LDKNTVLKLKDRIVKVVTPLGNGEHFERWGFDKKMILEDDWYKSIILDNGFTAHVTPTRHFSGRGLKRNQALWGSFVLETPSLKIYIGGDGGYGEHFAEIGKKYGPIDLAILENGQYDEKWKHIHMMPEEVLVAVKDLNAKTLLPVHSGKFTLGNHDWDEPLSRISKAYTNHDFRMITPMIGELVNPTDSTQSFTQWWKGVN
jgi:L-ascorbate metabolism protein UlaG (beta-lactamase superfamily)